MKYGIRADDRTTRALKVHVLCMSLRSVPAMRVESVFANYGRGDREGRFPTAEIAKIAALGCCGMMTQKSGAAPGSILFLML